LNYILKKRRVASFMLKKIRNCDAKIVNIHICFAQVLRDASFSGNINFNIAIHSKNRFHNKLKIIKYIKLQVSRVKKYYS